MADFAPVGLSFDLKQSTPMLLDIALAVRPGEVVALVGPSGAGKTSTLRAIAGLMTPSSGVVRSEMETWFSSREGINLPAQARRVGYVFQEYALFPHLSALENVRIACGHLDAAGSQRSAAGLLDRVGLSGLALRYPSELSGGQRQRVAIARALAREPKVLLLDEPFSAVDRPVRETLKSELQALRASLDIPVVLVTHDLSEAFGLADRIVVMDQGRLLHCASASELRRHPANIAVARFVGQSNFFKGNVAHATDGQVALLWGDVALPAGNIGVAGEVEWMLPSESIEIVTDTASPRDNGAVDVAATVLSVSVAGDIASVALTPNHRPQDVVSVAVPTWFLSRYAIAPGALATLRIAHKAPWIFNP